MTNLPKWGPETIRLSDRELETSRLSALKLIHSKYRKETRRVFVRMRNLKI
jgi:hypothetical protein